MQRYEIHHGDNLEWLRSQPDNSIDSFVTDPPYGLGKEPDMVKCLQDWIDHGYHVPSAKKGFMGREWDAFVPQPIFWKEVFRVLKPGGHVVSFGGTRTYDLMVLAIRLAGFEIRDQLIWMYGGGMPKGHNISKAIDKQAGAVREVVGKRNPHLDGGKRKSYTAATGTDYGVFDKIEMVNGEIDVTAPATPEAHQWDGWNTSLSPSHEPIVLARKPLEKGLTIAQNVLKWGTGALNIDRCRVGTREANESGWSQTGSKAGENTSLSGANYAREPKSEVGLGRWPSNLLLANVPDVIGLFPANAKSGKMTPNHKRHTGGQNQGDVYGKFDPEYPLKETIGDSGSASRYFFRADLLPIEQEEMNLPIHVKAIYCSKPSKYERQLGKISETSHPTVKPVALMHHLVTLITPPNGICVDPYCGSGTTGIAAMLGGFRFVGLEMTSEYIPIATNRIKNWKHYRQFVEAKKDDTPSKKARETTKAIQQSLF